MYNLNFEHAQVFQPIYEKHYRNIVLRGGRGGGKSIWAATYCITKALEEKRLILCARERQNSIKESVYNVIKGIIEEKIYADQLPETFFDFKVDEIEFANGSRFIFKGLSNMTVANIKSLFGTDICWVEEAAALSTQSLNTLSPTIRKENSQIIFTYNPETAFDAVTLKFGQVSDGDTFVKHLNYDSNPWFPQVLEQERLYSLKNDSKEVYEHIWLGKALADKELLIKNEVLEKCQGYKSNIEPKDYVKFIGVDCALEGNDSSVITVRCKDKILLQEAYKDMSGKDLALKVLHIYNKIEGKKYVLLDIIGIGQACYEYCKDFRLNPIGVDFRQTAINEMKYYKRRSECYGLMSERMKEGLEFPENCRFELLKELSYLPLKQNEDLIRLDDKKEIKQKLGKSPDRADSLALTFGLDGINELVSKHEYYDSIRQTKIKKVTHNRMKMP
jgi:PBSX family phage terminase large subunit